ncbi:MAG: uroporphyrinogen decarboxylase [Anaerolineaceae bacterium]|nr:uroporphyrinogen decarboxylase [Anaerolineaceae bacterium]|tara:strand:+ start:40317 stop:41300 length:984 start_codon:yes stop_codon:yes gene_type:complete
MNKKERLMAAISGGEVDRVPVAAWRHQPVDDQSSDAFAAATLAFQRDFDFDFVKVTPASSYCLTDWGATTYWRGSPHGTRDYGEALVQTVDEWRKLKVLSPLAGQMGEIIRGLELIGQGLEDDTPFIQTVFSPMTQARNLVGAEELLLHIRLHPDVIKDAFQIITNQTIRFIEAARETGISGIFYALQWASHLDLSESEYREFARPYDLQILNAVDDLWLNVLHLHGNHVMFSLIVDYPASVLNWHDRETKPSLSEGLKSWPKAVCGGIRQEDTLVQGTPKEIYAEGLDAIKSTNGKRLVLGTGCVAPIVTPYGNLRALRDMVDLKL